MHDRGSINGLLAIAVIILLCYAVQIANFAGDTKHHQYKPHRVGEGR
jgi:hypothetical protein